MEEANNKQLKRKVIHGHVVYCGDDCQDGIYYLSYNLDSSTSNDHFQAARRDYTGFEFESQRRHQNYILRYNKGNGSYILERGV